MNFPHAMLSVAPLGGFLPLLAFFGIVVWIDRGHRKYLAQLQQAYREQGIAFPTRAGFNAWAAFRVFPNDPTGLQTEKKRIISEIRKRNRHLIWMMLLVLGLVIVSVATDG